MDGQIVRCCGGGCCLGSSEAMSGVAKLPEDVLVTKDLLGACINKF